MTQADNFLPKGKKIAFIQASWHRDIVEQSRIAFTDTLVENGYLNSDIELLEVPGSLEIPLESKRLIESGRYALIVAAGLIVDGGIYRHDFVAQTVLDGMMRVQLDSGVPILSVVLTPHHFSGDQAHYDFFFSHFKLKGKEAANACMQTLANLASAPSHLSAA
ncbi:MAG: 6,7-dimethyl-8-ribityllumazine synthase [Acidiferrobacterales bacterium]|nr:6,7-dimethyl-8-ribityllumazine synthase [Acidiferrobacterales bacterium]